MFHFLFFLWAPPFIVLRGGKEKNKNGAEGAPPQEKKKLCECVCEKFSLSVARLTGSTSDVWNLNNKTFVNIKLVNRHVRVFLFFVWTRETDMIVSICFFFLFWNVVVI